MLNMLQFKCNNVWYCRAEKGDLRKIGYASLIATIQVMGLDDQFSYSLSPLMIRAKSGAICYFSGINVQTESDLTQQRGARK